MRRNGQSREGHHDLTVSVEEEQDDPSNLSSRDLSRLRNSGLGEYKAVCISVKIYSQIHQIQVMRESFKK